MCVFYEAVNLVFGRGIIIDTVLVWPFSATDLMPTLMHMHNLAFDFDTCTDYFCTIHNAQCTNYCTAFVFPIKLLHL